MEIFKITLIAMVFFINGFPLLCKGFPESCYALYEDSGADTVMWSPGCVSSLDAMITMYNENWNGFIDSLDCKKVSTNDDGGLLYDHNLTIPAYGQNSSKYSIRMLGFFGNDGGFLSRTYFKYTRDVFLVHAYFLQNGIHESHRYKDLPGRDEKLLGQISEVIRNDSKNSDQKLKTILKEALLRAVLDANLHFIKRLDIEHPDRFVRCPIIVLLFKGQVFAVETCDTREFLCRRPFAGGENGYTLNPMHPLPEKYSDEVLKILGHLALSTIQIPMPLVLGNYSDGIHKRYIDWRSLTDEGPYPLIAADSFYKWLTGKDCL